MDPINLKKHFFPIQDANVEATIMDSQSRTTLVTSNYRVILDKSNNGKQIYGVRPARTGIPNPTQVATHEEAYEGLRYLYSQFSKRTQGMPIAVFPNEGSNWFTAIYGLMDLNLNDWLLRYFDDKDNEMPIDLQSFSSKTSINMSTELLLKINRSLDISLKEYSDYVKKQKSSLFDDEKDKPRNVLSQFSFYLAVKNGYDYDDCVSYYLLIAPSGRDAIQYFEAEKADINEEYFAMKLLTLEYHSISINRNQSINDVPYKQAIGANDQKKIIDREKIYEKFENSLIDFIYTILMVDEQLVDSEVLASVTLDIYDMNRNYARLKNDREQCNKIRKKFNLSYSFYQLHEVENRMVKASHLIRFILEQMRYVYSITNISKDDFNEAFSRKKAYKNVVKLFPSMIRRGEFDKYCNSQFDDWNSICDLVNQ